MERALPTGTVTFLFTDVEGSTKLLYELGAEDYAARLAEHRHVLRTAFERHGGVEVDTQGDAFFVAFPTAAGALEAAREAQDALAIPVRMGIHTGTPLLTPEGYVGADVHKAARVASAGHGGQVLVSSAAAALLDASNSLLLDLGEHRLKDLTAPERIYQLGEGDFPPLKTLYRTNLPVPATPFLGREQELVRVLELLEETRLLTLTGPGGTGKTRLALQAAAESAEAYPDGVFWVPLAPLRDPALVLEQAAQAVGGEDDFSEAVADKRLLLLLDNLEHLIEAAEDLSGVLGACPNLRVLVTSRELLGLPGEQAYPVPPLEPEDGAKLFVARARAASPDFTPNGEVAELCARLDNLPLALELAAARVRVLSPKQLLERLSGRLDLLKAGRGVDARQQTLRATIEWSHELLDEEEQRLFARLSVFRGGCTLEAAEAVCDAGLDTLQSLVDKSLVRVRDEGRFWMLETIREYALELIEASREAEGVRRRHAEYFLALAEEAEPNLFASASPTEWLDRLEREHDNVRAALEWLASVGEAQSALRLAGGLSDFWYMRGFVAEGARRLEAALAGDEQPSPARAKALNGAATMAIALGDPAAGRRRAEEALALYRELGDVRGIANALWGVGYAVVEGGNPPAAEGALEESVRLFRELGDLDSAVGASRTLAFSYAERGEKERAFELHSDNLREARKIGNRQIEARSLGSMSFVAADLGRVDEALPLVYEAYRIDCELGNRLEIAVDVGRFAKILAVAGRADVAARLLSCSEALCEELEAAVPWVTRMYREIEAKLRAELDGDAFAQAWQQGRNLSADEAVELAFNPGISRDSG